MTANLPDPVPGLRRRLAALFYDGLLVLAIWFVVAALATALSGGRLAQPAPPLWMRALLQLALLTATWLFFAWFWTHGGQTLGMRAWRLKLVSVQGGTITWNQTVRRFTGALLSAAALGLGYLWILIDPQHRSWHDRLSGTRLIVLAGPR